MGASHSSESWQVNRRARKRGQTQTGLYRIKKSLKPRTSGCKSESDLTEASPIRPVYVNPLFQHQEMFDNSDVFFEEILAKIEHEAAKLTNLKSNGESVRGFDSFMLY